MITRELGPSEGAHGVQVHGAGELYMRDVTLQGGGGRAHDTQPLHVSSAAFAQGVLPTRLPLLSLLLVNKMHQQVLVFYEMRLKPFEFFEPHNWRDTSAKPQLAYWTESLRTSNSVSSFSSVQRFVRSSQGQYRHLWA